MINICVPSLNRAGESPTLDKLRNEGLLNFTHIFVYSFDVEAYSSTYPEATIVDCGNHKNLARKRNRILEYGLTKGWTSLLMIDDDITGVKVKDENQVLTNVNLTRLIYELESIPKGYVILAPRYNFIACDIITSVNKLIEFSAVSSVLFFDLTKIANYRFDENMIIEDMDLFLNIVLNGDKVYKLRHVQAMNKVAQKGGYQSYTKLEERHRRGIEELHNKYPMSKEFVVMTKHGFVGLNKRRLEKYVNENKVNTL